MHVLFAGGGDERRLYPGLSIAESLRDMIPEVEITFAGSGRSDENRLVRSAGHRYIVAPSKPAPHSTLEAVRFVTDNVAGYLAARWMLREHQVSLVVGLGGAPAATVVRAAHSRGVPFVLVERDLEPTRTARKLADAAEAVCLAYEQTEPHLPIGARAIFTGAPGRPTFHRLHPRAKARAERHDDESVARYGFDERRITVLACGELNDAMPEALRLIGDRLRGWRVVHQTGEGCLVETEARYRAAGVDALVLAYMDEVASVIDESDILICGADGTSLAEAALAATPAVVVPFGGLESSQRENAAAGAHGDAIRVVHPEAGRLAESIAAAVSPLVDDAELRRRCALNAASQAHPGAPDAVAQVCCEALGALRAAAA
ncbi:UDP-N-acetylglucosamine--N-acetylmuramyl-(pentapeptide) pyrophosphoryl-undecaprenol N-acetylglucosamine transferase [Pirellulimonas nuda]|nr:UDP-N-acetylglucosamine--N-acetylmuramyl-(pentapeptide) pyrophosphoryl-undecaprenol N-acetylglucosamine transferase [Pirellulimonas nuda]